MTGVQTCALPILRFDADSLSFALANLQRFDDALARAVVWLSLWDMTRDGDLAAEKFIDTTLALLATETESTTFRYALSCMSTTAWHYTAPDRRADVVKHVAKELWKLVIAAPGGSDQQFQLVTAYLGYGEEGDAEFAEHAQGLFDGSLIVAGLFGASILLGAAITDPVPRMPRPLVAARIQLSSAVRVWRLPHIKGLELDGFPRRYPAAYSRLVKDVDAMPRATAHVG